MDVAYNLKKISANTNYIYQKSKAMTFVSARDFVCMHHISMLEDGRLMIMVFTPKHNVDHIKAPEKKIVRGTLTVSNHLLLSLKTETQLAFGTSIDLTLNFLDRKLDSDPNIRDRDKG